jgi:CTP:molybdopterin cytidylyltransferase MocA/AcrR family transcriptional regulator
MRRHKAVLLAAGGSQRLGQPKQELTINGEPLIRHMARLLLDTSPKRLFVVVNVPVIARHLDGLDVEIVHNPNWRQGLSTSVQAAARALRRNAAPVLFAAVDQCRLDPAHLQALLAQASDTRDVVTRYDREAFGIPAVVTAATVRHAERLEGDRGFGQIWKSKVEDIVFVDAPHMGFDLDTPAELATAIRNRWIDAPSATPARVIKHAKTRQTLMDAAHTLFVRHGYDETSFDDIAKAAETSRRTVFRYFDSKSDIALAWMTDVGETLGAAIRDAPAGLSTAGLLEHGFARFASDDRPRISLGTIARAGAGDVKDLSLAGFARWETIVADALAGRGTVEPVLTARIGIALLRTAFELCNADPHASFENVVKDLLRQARASITNS